MAIAIQALLVRFAALGRTARAAPQFTPHVALLLLLAAIISHSLGLHGVAQTLGDATFFSLALAVILRRDVP